MFPLLKRHRMHKRTNVLKHFLFLQNEKKENLELNI